MKQRKRFIGLLFVVVIILIAIAGYLYYRVSPHSSKREGRASNTVTATETTSKNNTSATTEQRKKLPENYVWDTMRLGEPPQIIYDFAENQERFDYIVGKVDSIISEGDGFSTGIENNKIYYDSGYKNMEEITTVKFKKDITYILNNTNFYEITKEEGGRWIMYYNQQEDKEHFIFTMIYKSEMTDEQAYEEGYYRVVGDWFFWTIWKI